MYFFANEELKNNYELKRKCVELEANTYKYASLKIKKGC